jgi:hypothetical protein
MQSKDLKEKGISTLQQGLVVTYPDSYLSEKLQAFVSESSESHQIIISQ